MAKKRRRRSLGNAQHRQVQARLDARETLGYEVGLIIQKLAREEKEFDRALRDKNCRKANSAFVSMKRTWQGFSQTQREAARYGVTSANLQDRERHFKRLVKDADYALRRRCPV